MMVLFVCLCYAGEGHTRKCTSDQQREWREISSSCHLLIFLALPSSLPLSPLLPSLLSSVLPFLPLLPSLLSSVLPFIISLATPRDTWPKMDKPGTSPTLLCALRVVDTNGTFFPIDRANYATGRLQGWVRI